MSGDDHFIRPDNNLVDPVEDLLRNIAGLDDSNLFVSSHEILVAAVREWRDEARKILGAS